MNTNFSKFIAILVVAIVPFIVGCRPTRPEIIKQNPAFAEHVAGYTSGMISRKSSIRVELENFVGDTSNINENTLPDSSLLKDIFSFEPAIAGHAIWINARTIEFIPDEALPVNQFYTAAFDLDRVAKVKRELSTFTFQFASFQQKMYVNSYGLENYDYYNLEWQYVNGRIKTTDETDTSNLRKTITATQDGKQLPIRIMEGYDDNEYQFVVDSVERRRSKSEVIILWNGKEIGSSSRGKINLDVSPLGDFTVQNTKIVDVMDQSVELTFSEPLLANQNLKGIITLQDVDNLSFKINYNTVTVFLPNRLLGDKFLNISNGIKNLRGYNMLQEYQTTLTFEEPKPMVRIIGNGSILPNSSGLIFPFEAVSLKAIDVRVIKIYENNIHHFLQVNNLDGDDGLTRFGKVVLRKKIDLTYDKTMDLKKWNKHVIDLGKLIDPDPGAIYRISIKFTKKYALCDCEAETEENNANQTNEDNEDENWSEKLWDSYGFDDGFDSWEDYSDDDSPCSNDYYYGKAQSRNILASDIGLIYKLDESKLTHVFANNMLTTDPMQNVEIQYYSFSKQLIASGKTDVNGMLEIQLKEKPFLLVAKNGKQRAYLKLADGYANSLSKFDIEGEQVQKGIKGFIYAERGVWRPGDSLFTAFILENKDNLLPSNHPVKFDLTDPNGSLVQTMTTTKHLNGVYDFRTATSSEAITGNYTATVSVGNRRYTKNIKIETIKPNRLKIYLNMDKVQAKDSFADLRVQWLHGAIARNLKATVSVSVSAKKTTFDAYKNYSFDSPVRYYASNEESIFEGKVNNLGEAKIKTALNVGQNAPGMLRATYTTKVFEESGDFSIDRCTKSYSPFQTYVGIQIPSSKTADKSLETGKNYKLNIVCLNDEGKLKNTARLQVKVYRMEWRWWYQQTEEDLSNFMSRNGTLVIKDTIIAAADGKALFPFRVDYPDYGRFMVTVTDLEGNHQTGEIVTVDWPYLSRGNRTNNENANMLNFTSDKEKYTLGDKVKLSIPSSGAGRALISIETRSKVLKKYWISTQKGETIHELLATKDMAPNVFIHVTLIQPHANTKNDLPIRMYGVIPLLVDDPATHIIPPLKQKVQKQKLQNLSKHQ